MINNDMQSGVYHRCGDGYKGTRQCCGKVRPSGCFPRGGKNNPSYRCCVCYKQDPNSSAKKRVRDRLWRRNLRRSQARSGLLYDFDATAASMDFTYFILDQQSNRIKIGRSSHPNRRLQQLKTGSANDLEIVATLPGGENESVLHDRFRHLRIKGEWFSYSSELKNYIQSLSRNEQIA